MRRFPLSVAIGNALARMTETGCRHMIARYVDPASLWFLGRLRVMVYLVVLAIRCTCVSMHEWWGAALHAGEGDHCTYGVLLRNSVTVFSHVELSQIVQGGSVRHEITLWRAQAPNERAGLELVHQEGGRLREAIAILSGWRLVRDERLDFRTESQSAITHLIFVAVRARFDLIETDRRSNHLFLRASFPKTVSHFSGCALMWFSTWCGMDFLTKSG
ncbi:hypothetical protein [Brucella tritici]|uniref:hypothetical protein n=1 Tax=Brucella tritici TaxID=94626 RepID=UPI001591A03E|nr:hypothetical protein [Brucella tritici]